MKSPRFAFVPALLLLLVVFFSCEKQASNPVEPQEDFSGLRANSSAVCDTFRYADTIFYLREQPADYIVKPVTAQSGKYGSYPVGMIISSSTGAINVTKSETGLKYRVWFVKTGASDTCTRYVTLSGINYTSGLYRLNLNDTLAKPFYNAVRTASTPCKDKDDDDKDKKDKNKDCEFDDGSDDDDGDGMDDEPPTGRQVAKQGVDINKLVGGINLRQTVANGTFGATPVNGASKSIRIYYRLNEASKKALNFIDVTLHYYTKASMVPASLLSQISDKQGATLRRAAPGTVALTNGSTMEATRPRPPDIVVTKE